MCVILITISTNQYLTMNNCVYVDTLLTSGKTLTFKIEWVLGMKDGDNVCVCVSLCVVI